MISPWIRKIKDTLTRTCWRLRCCINWIPSDPSADLLSCIVNLIGDNGHNSAQGCRIGFRLLMQSLRPCQTPFSILHKFGVRSSDGEHLLVRNGGDSGLLNDSTDQVIQDAANSEEEISNNGAECGGAFGLKANPQHERIEFFISLGDEFALTFAVGLEDIKHVCKVFLCPDQFLFNALDTVASHEETLSHSLRTFA